MVSSTGRGRPDDALLGDVPESGGPVVCISRGTGTYTATLNVALNDDIAGDIANVVQSTDGTF